MDDIGQDSNIIQFDNTRVNHKRRERHDILFVSDILGIDEQLVSILDSLLVEYRDFPDDFILSDEDVDNVRILRNRIVACSKDNEDDGLVSVCAFSESEVSDVLTYLILAWSIQNKSSEFRELMVEQMYSILSLEQRREFQSWMKRFELSD